MQIISCIPQKSYLVILRFAKEEIKRGSGSHPGHCMSLPPFQEQEVVEPELSVLP